MSTSKFESHEFHTALGVLESTNPSNDDHSNSGLLQDYNKQRALILLGTGRKAEVSVDLWKFNELDEEVAIKMIELGSGWAVAENLDRFSKIDHKKIALKFIENNSSGSLARHIEKFKGLDKEVALGLIETDGIWAAARNLDRFDDLDEEVAIKMIEAGYGTEVAENLDRFNGINHTDMALRILAERNGIFTLNRGLSNFRGLSKAVALKMLEQLDNRNKGTLIGNLIDRFDGLDEEVAMKLVEAGATWVVMKHLDRFGKISSEFKEKHLGSISK